MPLYIALECLILCIAFMYSLWFIHTVRFFLIPTAIPLITENGLYRIEWKCLHYVTVTTSPAPKQPL